MIVNNIMAGSCVVVEPRFPSKCLDSVSPKFSYRHLGVLGMLRGSGFECAVCIKHSTNTKELHLQSMLDED